MPSDHSSAALPELPPKLVRNMGDTYAVVNKGRRSGAGTSPVTEIKPEGDTPLYAAVKTRSSNVPDAAAIDPNAFVGMQGSHSLPGSPIRHASPSTSCEYAHINPSIPGDANPRATPSSSHTNGVGKNLLRTLMSPVLSSSSAKKAPPSPRTVPMQAYEDVGDVTSRGVPNTMATSNNPMGFNFRIGKPKGPRDPPAGWSRV